jgi:hypothetical protein
MENCETNSWDIQADYKFFLKKNGEKIHERRVLG